MKLRTLFLLFFAQFTIISGRAQNVFLVLNNSQCSKCNIGISKIEHITRRFDIIVPEKDQRDFLKVIENISTPFGHTLISDSLYRTFPFSEYPMFYIRNTKGQVTSFPATELPKYIKFINSIPDPVLASSDTFTTKQNISRNNSIYSTKAFTYIFDRPAKTLYSILNSDKAFNKIFTSTSLNDSLLLLKVFKGHDSSFEATLKNSRLIKSKIGSNDGLQSISLVNDTLFGLYAFSFVETKVKNGKTYARLQYTFFVIKFTSENSPEIYTIRYTRSRNILQPNDGLFAQNDTFYFRTLQYSNRDKALRKKCVAQYVRMGDELVFHRYMPPSIPKDLINLEHKSSSSKGVSISQTSSDFSNQGLMYFRQSNYAINIMSGEKISLHLIMRKPNIEMQKKGVFDEDNLLKLEESLSGYTYISVESSKYLLHYECAITPTTFHNTIPLPLIEGEHFTFHINGNMLTAFCAKRNLLLKFKL